MLFLDNLTQNSKLLSEEVGVGTKIHKNSLKFDTKISLVIIEK